MLGNFAHFFVVCQFIKIFFFFQENHQSVKKFGQNIGPDLGPYCLQKLQADDKTGQWEECSYCPASQE